MLEWVVPRHCIIETSFLPACLPAHHSLHMNEYDSAIVHGLDWDALAGGTSASYAKYASEEELELELERED